LAPTVDELEKTYGSKIVFVRLDVSDAKNQELAVKANIRVVPTLHFINKKGKLLKELQGSLSKETLEAELKNIEK
jgi:thiol-disulfide isomerase/thioredoxin